MRHKELIAISFKSNNVDYARVAFTALWLWALWVFVRNGIEMAKKSPQRFLSLSLPFIRLSRSERSMANIVGNILLLCCFNLRLFEISQKFLCDGLNRALYEIEWFQCSIAPKLINCYSVCERKLRLETIKAHAALGMTKTNRKKYRNLAFNFNFKWFSDFRFTRVD